MVKVLKQKCARELPRLWRGAVVETRWMCKGGARGGLQLEGDYGRAPYATQREAMEEAVETVREQGGATCLNEFVNQSDLNKVYKLN